MNTIIITAGDPGGIGYEIILKSLDFLNQRPEKIIVIGNESAFRYYAELFHIPFKWGKIDFLPVDNKEWTPEVGKESKQNGTIVIQTLDKAIEIIKKENNACLVTCPISKKAVVLAGKKNFSGHTEYLAEAFGIKDFTMVLANKDFAVGLVTIHIPLKKVAKAIKPSKIISAVKNLSLLAQKRKHEPIIYVCGLNPHAGENGVLGKEEINIIIPTLKKLQEQGYQVKGPYPADSLFKKAYQKTAQYFLSMYHDQGLIPVKMLGNNQTVNMTLGLPFFRISVEHGTAFDIAGKNCADNRSFLTCFEWIG